MSSYNVNILLIEDDRIDQMAFERMVRDSNLPYKYQIVLITYLPMASLLRCSIQLLKHRLFS
jgi:hypothetical protein